MRTTFRCNSLKLALKIIGFIPNMFHFYWKAKNHACMGQIAYDFDTIFVSFFLYVRSVAEFFPLVLFCMILWRKHFFCANYGVSIVPFVSFFWMMLSYASSLIFIGRNKFMCARVGPITHDYDITLVYLFFV